jgi:hypothetical protein
MLLCIVIDETTKFTLHMCHEPVASCVRKITFSCSSCAVLVTEDVVSPFLQYGDTIHFCLLACYNKKIVFFNLMK